MEKIKIITDSTAYLSKEYIDSNNISIVSLSYIFDEITEKEGYGKDFDEYFIMLKNSELFPSTSQPATGDLYEAFNSALNDYDKVIGIFLSSKLSGTYNNALLAKDLIDNEKKHNIEIIDSKLSVAALGFLVEDAVRMASDNKSHEEIIEYINDKKDKIEVFLTTGSLEYLSRGGRLSTLEYKMGNLLKIKPIIELSEGELKLVDKVHGRKKALNNILDRINDDVSRIAICQILAIEEAEEIKNRLKDKYPNANVTIEHLGPVIGSHLGESTLGICYY